MRNKRPSAIWHMVKWGIGSGFILAFSYIVIFIDVFEVGNGDFSALFLFTNLFIWYLSFMVGAVPGAIMGFFLGMNLGNSLAKVTLPFTKSRMRNRRFKIYASTFLITIFFSFSLLFLFLGNAVPVSLFLIPPFIAAIAATYAAHRYMYRLRIWSGGIEARKSKAKNEALASSRLAEPERSQKTYYEESNSYAQSEEQS